MGNVIVVWVCSLLVAASGVVSWVGIWSHNAHLLIGGLFSALVFGMVGMFLLQTWEHDG